MHLDSLAATGEPLWGYMVHHTIAPIYLHNYFLGDVMNEAMMDVFKRHRKVRAEAAPKEFGNFWREKVLKPSGRYTFRELFEKVCEAPLNLDVFLEV